MPNTLSALFHARIGYRGEGRVRFADLERILELAALAIPFENLSIVEKRSEPVSRESLMRKILMRGEGGLCYELNPLLFFYLQEQGFAVRLARGSVYDAESGRFSQTGRTHVAVLLAHAGQTWLIDTGFGGNVPLKPVPLTGEAVASQAGSFRVAKRETEHGNYVLEMKIRHKDDDWRTGYAFDSRAPVDERDLEDVRAIIERHPASSFNKHRIVTRLTERGSITLTDHSLTRWTDGVQHKEPIGKAAFGRLYGQYFARRDGGSAGAGIPPCPRRL